MKRLMILTVLTLGPVLLAGCNSAWPRCSWFRGDECTPYPTYQGMPMISEGVYMAPSTGVPEILPGPASSGPST